VNGARWVHTAVIDSHAVVLVSSSQTYSGGVV
jgi:hypothetical protein